MLLINEKRKNLENRNKQKNENDFVLDFQTIMILMQGKKRKFLVRKICFRSTTWKKNTCLKLKEN